GRAVGPLVGTRQRRHAAVRVELEGMARLALVQRVVEVLQLRRMEGPVIHHPLQRTCDAVGHRRGLQVARHDGELPVAGRVLDGGQLHVRGASLSVGRRSRQNTKPWQAGRQALRVRRILAKAAAQKRPQRQEPPMQRRAASGDANDIETLRRILATSRVVAVVGLSADWFRPSFFAAKYLKSHGYRIVPVNPKYPSILGETCYPALDAIPPELARSIDIVDCFRRTEDILPLAE